MITIIIITFLFICLIGFLSYLNFIERKDLLNRVMSRNLAEYKYYTDVVDKVAEEKPVEREAPSVDLSVFEEDWSGLEGGNK